MWTTPTMGIHLLLLYILAASTLLEVGSTQLSKILLYAEAFPFIGIKGPSKPLKIATDQSMWTGVSMYENMKPSKNYFLKVQFRHLTKTISHISLLISCISQVFMFGRKSG